MSPSESIAERIRAVLRKGGSREHAAGVQRFFKEEIQSHGWYTADLRRLAHKQRAEILAEGGLKLLLAVADELFRGECLEERGIAIELLRKDVRKFGDKEFQRFEKWLGRVISWADHDGLVYHLIGTMMVADPSRVRRIHTWARSRNRWHRRASAVALIPGVRRNVFFHETQHLYAKLKHETDDIVLKGIGWLLREAAKSDAPAILPFLMEIRGSAPRLVLRTACETLPPKTRAQVLGR